MAFWPGFRPRLRRLLWRRIKNRDEAEDLESQVVLSVLTLPNPEKINNMESYVYTIASNILNHQFNERRLKREALPQLLQEYSQLLMGSAPLSQEEAVHLQQKLAVVNEALSELTDQERLVFELYRTGKTYAEIAEITRVPLSTIWSQAERAHDKIRARCAPDTQE